MKDAVATRVRRGAVSSTSNLTAVASGKGGVGKTWISISLAHALSRAGQRTLLFDGDLGLANVDIQLGLQPDNDLGGVIAGRYSMDQAVFPYGLGGFDVLAGRSGSGTLANLPLGKLTEVTEQLDRIAAGYDQVILDLGAGIERTVRHFAVHAARCLVVATDEPTSLTDAYALIKLCIRQNSAANFGVLVNMAASDEEGRRTYGTLRKACQSFLQFTPPLAGIIPRDPRVKDAIRSQASLFTRHPNSASAKPIESLARVVLRDLR